MKNKKKKQVKKIVKKAVKSARKLARKLAKKPAKKVARKLAKKSTPKKKAVKKVVAKVKKTVAKVKKVVKPVKHAKRPIKSVKPIKHTKPEKKKISKSEPIVKQVKKCKKSLCKEPAFANGYCRYHYIASWKAEHIDKRVRKIKHLEKLIIEIKKRFPNQYLDLIKADLMSDKIFRQVLKDMDLEEDISDFEISDDTQRIIDSYSTLVESGGNDEEY